MSGALQSGVSGLRAHQRMLEVVGNNLANLNTVAYKGARVEFADQLSQTLKAGSRPGGASQGAQGGINPSQLGLGVAVSNIAIDTNQGSLQATGRILDLAIQGDGFLQVQDGSRKLFTRAGTLDIDSSGYLVHTTSGMRVSGVGNKDIQISNRDIPASVTSTMSVGGNLSADSRPPLTEVQTSLLPFEARASVTGTLSEPYDLSAFGAYDFQVQVGTGSVQTVSLTPGNPVTASSIATEINTQASGVRAVVIGNAVTLQSTASGAAANFTLTDGTNSPLAILGLAAGTQAGAVPGVGTELNDLGSNSTPYVAGDVILINGRDDGTTISPPISFVYGSGPGQNGTTLGDLVSRINTGFANATVTLDQGNMVLTAGGPGNVDYALSLGDQTGNTGSTNLAQHTLGITTDGFDGDTVTTSVEVFDSLGDSHIVDLSFAYRGGNLWDLTATSNEAGVTVTQPTITGITFSRTGEFANVQSSPNIGLSFDPTMGNLVDDMAINLDFGTPGQGDGLTMFSGSSEAAITNQDGNAPGKLTTLSVDRDGTILGLYDNGLSQSLDQIKVVSFSNPGGLLRSGSNLWEVSPNSGSESTVGVGEVVSGVLENSNVDTALEFTRLIIAQRGFQVNARTITTTDQMLQELANLVR